MNEQTMKRANTIIILFGLVSLFADITYESARSILGPYIGILGGSIALAGIAGGLGEMIAYSLRTITGYIADKFKSYWFFTILGYIIGLFSIPIMGFCQSATQVFILSQTERLGKALRNPSRDYLISTVSTKYGRSFALHEAIDQIGAVIGPILVAIIVSYAGYSAALKLMIIPTTISILLLIATKKIYSDEMKKFSDDKTIVPKTQSENQNNKDKLKTYITFAFLTNLGFINFQIISFHFKSSGLSDFWIPIAYAIAMLVDSITAIPFGILFDRKPILTLSFIPIFGFASSFSLLNPVSIIFWGAYMGLSESILKSGLAKISRKATSFGILHFSSGISSLISSVIFSKIYDFGINWIILFSLITQALSLFVLIKNLERFK